VIFGMKPKKNQKETREITVLKDGMRWRFGGNSNRHSSRGKLWTTYIEHVTSERFSHWFGDDAHWWIRPIQCTCKTDGKINFSEIYH
jgi:hypothetical protein